MKLKVNNLELNAVLEAIETQLDHVNDPLTLAALKSFVKKVNDNSTTITWKPEESALDILENIKEIEEEAI